MTENTSKCCQITPFLPLPEAARRACSYPALPRRLQEKLNIPQNMYKRMYAFPPAQPRPIGCSMLDAPHTLPALLRPVAHPPAQHEDQAAGIISLTGRTSSRSAQ